MWNLLIQPLVGLVSTHLNNKAEAKQAVHKSNLKKIESESSWENNQSMQITLGKMSGLLLYFQFL
jgi:hypothetical protein